MIGTTEFHVSVTGSGATLALDRVTVNMRVLGDGLRARLHVSDAGGIIFTDTAILASHEDRQRLLAGMAAAGAVVTDAALMALEQALQSDVPGLEPVTGEAATGQNDRAAAKESAAAVMVRLVQDELNAELFHTPGGDAYMSIPVAAHRETFPLKSKGFRDWLARVYYQSTGKAPNSNAVQDAKLALAGVACYDGPEHEVFLRVAPAGPAIYIDLCNPSHSAVEVTATGWRVVDRPPVYFRRPPGQLALPTPQRGGDLRRLREFVNLASEEDFVLAVSWLVGALRPPGISVGAYPVLKITGEQGSAKSMAAKVMREMVDPCTGLLRSKPKEERDLMIAALNGHVVSFDNVSTLSDSMSDVLCRLASGASLSARTLYADDEETILSAHRPVIINGITEMVTRGDLLDRTISLSLPSIPEEQRKRESDVWQQFKAAHPALLGAVLDAVVSAVAHQDTVEIDRPPRLADFATWMVAAEAACPWPAGTFLSAFRGSQASAIEAALDGDPVADAVLALPPTWTGTSKDLLDDKINAGVAEGSRRHPDWPKSPKAVSERLRRLAGPMKKLGIEVVFPGRSNKNGRQFTILRDLERFPSKSGDGSPDGGSTVPSINAKNWPNSEAGDGGDGGDGSFAGLFASGGPDVEVVDAVDL